MKKILLILLLVPSFVFGQTYYRIYADTTIFGSIGSGKNEVVIKNRTKDSTGGFLSNKGNGVLEFKKLRNKKINDSTYVIVSGTTVLGDTLKIKGSGGSGGGVSQSALNDSIATVRNIRNVDTIYKVTDSIVYKINGVRYSVIDNSGGGGSDSLIYNRTYLDLANDITGSDLKIGATYKITDKGDKGLFFKAIKANELDKSGIRLMLCPANYTISGIWKGIWKDTKTVSINDLVIWGGFVWKNLSGSIGVALNDITLDENWEIVDKATFTNGEYTERQFDVVYDFANDWIQYQSDDAGNTTGEAVQSLSQLPSLANPADHCDWNSSYGGGTIYLGNLNATHGFFNNECTIIAQNIISGIINNYTGNNILHNDGISIKGNRNTGEIGQCNSNFIINLGSGVGDVTNCLNTAGAIDGNNAPYDTWSGDIIGLQFNGTYATDNTVELIVGKNANGETKMVDKSSINGETIVELGTITYADINSAPATQDISIPLTTNDFPDSSYCVGIIYKFTEYFDGGSDNGVIYDVFNSYVYDLTQAVAITNYISDPTGILFNQNYGREQLKKGAFQLSLPIQFQAGANPQDFTNGSVTIYAITKPFPF